MKIYNKLVRDRIPEIIEASGARCETKTLPYVEYLWALDSKLDEELAEFRKSRDPEELADLLEVIYAMAGALGVTAEELNRIREEKAAQRGRFDKRIMLLSVEEVQK